MDNRVLSSHVPAGTIAANRAGHEAPRVRWLSRVILAALLLLVPAAGAVAAVSDHLECYRVEDPLALDGVVDITSPTLGIEAGCKLGRAVLFCVPASKTVVAVNTPELPVVGRPLSDARLCYEIACPLRHMYDQSVTDQFGHRVVSDLRPRLLCTPAVTGSPSPTQDGLDDVVCHQMRDPTKVRGMVHLDSDQFGVAAGCRLSRGMGPFSFFCVGASTEVRQVNVSPLLPIGGTGMDEDRICYLTTCPRPAPVDQVVSDRFGSRTLAGLMPRMFCGPAISAGTDPALVCQRAIELGGMAYTREVLQAIEDCAATGQDRSTYECLASPSVEQQLAALRAQWAVDAGAACASTDIRHDLGYAEMCGATPSACTSASVGVEGVLDCLTCRIGEHLQGAAAKLYADRVDTGGCRGALGGGMQEVRATLQQLHECVNRPGATSVAECFKPSFAAWRAQAEAACAGVDAFGSLGYPQLCSGHTHGKLDGCAEHAVPCSFSGTSSLSAGGEDNDLLDCLTCQAEEAALGVARDLYGANVCCIGGACNTILTRTVCRAAGGTPARYRVDSLTLSAPISAPHGIQVGPDGFLYLIDTSIRKVNRDTGKVSFLTSPGWGTGIVIDPSGNVYFTKRCDHQVYKMTSGGRVSVLAGTGVAGHTGDEGPASVARIAAPDGITLDAAGNVYFTESGLLAAFCGAASANSERVRMVDTSGIIHTVAGGNIYGVRGEGGPAVEARLAVPYSLRFAADGSLLVGEDGAMRVLRIAGGIINRVAGRVQTPLAATHSGYGGPALRARFYHTCGLTGDLDGNVLVGAEDNQVTLVDRLGSVTEIAGTGEGGIRGEANGDGGPATLARGFCCEDISVAADGRIYCSELGINRIRVLTRELF